MAITLTALFKLETMGGGTATAYYHEDNDEYYAELVDIDGYVIDSYYAPSIVDGREQCHDARWHACLAWVNSWQAWPGETVTYAPFVEDF